MTRPAFLFAALALVLSGCGAPAGVLALAACKVPATARLIPACKDPAPVPEAPEPAPVASEAAPRPPAEPAGKTLAEAAADKAAASRIDIDFLAGLWMDKGMQCGAATGAFYVFERNMTFSAPSMEAGKFTLKGQVLTLLPEDEFTGKVARREVVDLKRDGDNLIMAGAPMKKCARYSRCIEKKLPLADCNTY